MALQSVIDESEDEDGTFVLGGYISTANEWAEFSREWKELLPGWGLQKRSGVWHFKMAEMAAAGYLDTQEGVERIQAFYRIIERHVLASISVKFNRNSLKRAQSNITAPNLKIDWGNYANPYYVSFFCLMSSFHSHRDQIVRNTPLSEKVDFYFDSRSEQKAIDEAWSGFLAKSPTAVREQFGSNPTFCDDEEFLPLQSADFWVWWVRQWYTEGTPEKVQNWNFGIFDDGKTRREKYLRIQITYDEDQLAIVMMRLLRDQIGLGIPIIYVKTS